MTHFRLSRRDLLKQAVTGASVGSLAGYCPIRRSAWAADWAANRLGVGCIGMGQMGLADAREHASYGEIRAVCDVDSQRVVAARLNPKIGNGRADAYADYRRVLDRKDIDVVSVVTPDHWHVKMAIEALQAGKHVFCQKPLTLTLAENRLIRNACQKYPKQAFAVGTQQRSSKDLFLRAVNMVQKGLLGDIRKVTCGIHGSPGGGPFSKIAPPAGLDWDFWLGQAPKVDYMENRCHYNFRWWYEYSGGKFTDWGAHHIDIATWALQQDKPGQGPVEIDGSDANHPIPFQDGYPTVDNYYNASHDFAVKCKFANGVELIVTSRGDNGIQFEGTKGRLFVNRAKIAGTPVEQNWDMVEFGPEDLVRLYKGKPFESHKSNFYRCIREGGLPVSDVFSHVMTMNTCHLATIAARLNRVIRWDPAAEKIIGDRQAEGFVSRLPRPGFEIPEV